MEKLFYYFAWVCRLFLGLVFLLAGVGKLLAPTEPARLWGTWLQTNTLLLVIVFAVLSVAEIACAIGIVLRHRLAYRVAAALSGLFLLVSVLRYTQIVPIPFCGCFGLLRLGPEGGAEVVRDSLLLSASVLLLLDSKEQIETRMGVRS